MKSLCLLLPLAAGLGMSLPVKAASCSASLSNINFGNVDPFGGNVDVSGTLGFSCSRGLFDVLENFIRICFDIGDGSMGNGSINPRRMGNGGGQYLNFNLFSDAARSVIWGHPSYAFPTVSVVRDYNLLGTSFSDSIQIYGRVFSGQTTAVPGSYSNSFSGVHARIRWADGIAAPSNCNEGSANFSFSTLATIQSQCSVSASNMNFGSQGFLDSAVDTTSSVFVTCTNSSAYQVGLNNGMHASGNTRRMHSGGNYVTYELYRDTARTLRWGNTLNTDTRTGTGSGSQQTLTVYGRVPAQTPRPVGSYSDTITVTITY